MTLREKQSLFVKLLGELVGWVYANGWQLTLGEGYRADRAGHMIGSLHYERLAQDLNLFVEGVWKQAECPEWEAVGTAWKALDPLARWGGDFASKDLNHVSLAHEGKA